MLLAAAGIIKLVAEFAPDIIGLFSKDKGDKVGDVIDSVMKVTKAITGTDDEQEAMALLGADPALAYEFKKALLADSHIEEQMRYSDVSDARAMYKQQNDMADYVGKTIIDRNLIYVAGLILVDVILMIALPVVFPDSAAISTGVGMSIGTLLGGVIQQLLKERQDIVNFLFGSSRGSKNKDVNNAK